MISKAHKRAAASCGHFHVVIQGRSQEGGPGGPGTPQFNPTKIRIKRVHTIHMHCALG